jgi:trimeric autotransporter adhesin
LESIKNTYINALLSHASYANGLDKNLDKSGIKNKLSDLMTEPLAEFISDNFRIIDSIDSSDDGGSGFDATIWRGLLSSPYAGKTYISMRGTDGTADYLADGNLALIGAPVNQYKDMANWFLRNIAREGEMAPGVDYESSVFGILNFKSGGLQIGTGWLSDVTHVEVTGHSLGGYLATAFARMFGGVLTIDHVASFNSPGFFPGNQPYFDELNRLIGTGLNGFLESIQDNFFADHGVNFTTSDLIPHQVGRRVGLFNESNALKLIANHSMYKLTDVLAIASVLETLHPTLSISSINALLEYASNESSASIEEVTNSLRRLLIEPDATNLLVGDEGGSVLSRVEYHNALKQLIDNTNFKPLEGKVNINLITLASKTQARTDFGAMASLLKLSPLTMTGVDSSLDTSFKSVWGATYQNWEADKKMSAIDKEKGIQTYTDVYINQRSDMLTWLMNFNNRDMAYDKRLNTLGGLFPMPTDGDFLYEDAATKLKLDIDGANLTTLASHRISFGDEKKICSVATVLKTIYLAAQVPIY